MESESIPLDMGISECGIRTQQGDEYRKENTGMQCWKGTGMEMGTGTML